MFNLSLTKQYIPATVIIALFVILGYYLSNMTLQSNKEYAKIINISGKQRMLSQRLVIDAKNYLTNKTYKNKQALYSIIDEMENAHEYLLLNLLSNELRTIYFEQSLDINFKKYLSYFHELLRTKDESLLLSARQDSKKILIQLDKAVKAYEKAANSSLQKASRHQLFIMLATLVVLALVVLFIFVPAARKIDSDTKKLKEKEDYENTVIEANNNAIVAIDGTGKITSFNKKAETVFGYSKDEMIGTNNLAKLVPPEFKEAHNLASKHYLSTGESCGVIDNSHELEGIRKDGTRFPLRISFGASWKPDNPIVVASIVDITLEKQKDIILQRQSKLASMGEMMDAIGHQWKQPLSAISSISSGILLLNEMYETVSKEEVTEAMHGIEEQVNHLVETVDDFRMFFRPNVEKTQTNIKELIESTLKLNLKLLSQNSISTSIICDENISYNLIPSEFKHILINLISNAKDAFNEKDISNRKLEFKVERDHIYLTISVFDNAGGIPENIIGDIFNANITTKELGKGTGIGLYMSKQIVEKIGGVIYAKNILDENNNSLGVRFSIDLPLKNNI